MSEPERTDRVEVRQEPDGTWRWRYVGTDPEGETVELPSTSTQPSREAAVAAARRAYPRLPVDVPGEDPQEEPRSRPRRRRRARRWLAVGALLVVFGLLARWGARRGWVDPALDDVHLDDVDHLDLPVDDRPRNLPSPLRGSPFPRRGSRRRRAPARAGGAAAPR